MLAVWELQQQWLINWSTFVAKPLPIGFEPDKKLSQKKNCSNRIKKKRIAKNRNLILHNQTKKNLFGVWNFRTDFCYIGRANSKYENCFSTSYIFCACPGRDISPSDRSAISGNVAERRFFIFVAWLKVSVLNYSRFAQARDML